eukprot:CAMPEP_0115441602 /NCGR_PEP_ID=MMETSP0271-20121206/36912_1 /TAXON_ID=71861 /ORGANISM="Scrippsiella trochoidea, Strain CCMP3099" /LENGTH=72 /DNA_ID=CAMNT_0002867401 /DNA_START=82 /DNA_END=300 /DNA_ORIENTATION=-
MIHLLPMSMQSTRESAAGYMRTMKALGTSKADATLWACQSSEKHKCANIKPDTSGNLLMMHAQQIDAVLQAI